MKHVCFTILFIITSLVVNSQVELYSPDKNYRIEKGIGEEKLLVSKDGNWSNKMLSLSQNILFSHDSKYLLFTKKDSLIIIQLKNLKIRAIGNVKNYLVPRRKSDYVFATFPNDVVGIVNIATTEVQKIENVNQVTTNYYSGNNSIVVESKDISNARILVWIDLLKGTRKNIWTSNKSWPDKLYISDSSDRVAFLVKEDSNKVKSSIYFFKNDMQSAHRLVDIKTTGFDCRFVLADERLGFSKSGKTLTFYVEEAKLPAIREDKITYWSYVDPMFQSQMAMAKRRIRQYLCTINVEQKAAPLVQVERENERALSYFTHLTVGLPSLANDDFMVVSHFQGEYLYGLKDPSYFTSDYTWSRLSRVEIFLVSLNNGTRRLITDNVRDFAEKITLSNRNFQFSPDNKFVIWYDNSPKAYFSYDVQQDIVRNISATIPESIIAEQNNFRQNYYAPVGIVKWHKGFVYVYDKWTDIWQIDPAGVKKPTCITNCFAKINKINFNYYENGIKNQNREDDSLFLNVSFSPSRGGYPVDVVKTNDEYGISLISQSNPKLVNKDIAYTIGRVLGTKKTTCKRDTVTWRAYDGALLTGVITYPKNFRSDRRYPVITQFYSDESFLNSDCNNEDYVNFTLAMKYTGPGRRSDDVYNCLGSATDYLARLSFIDSSKIGLWGHSFGGYQTYLAAVRVKRFAAIIVSSGITDLVSSYLGVEKDEQGASRQNRTEAGQVYVGVTLYERPDLYIKNSPIFYVDRVRAPMLLFAATSDERVSYTQSLEFFKAMRRLGKPCWLILGGEGYNHVDLPYSPHTSQFFDHFLLSKPAPIWMTQSVMPRADAGDVTKYDSLNKNIPKGLLLDENEIMRTPEEKKLLENRTTFDFNGKVIDVKKKN